jgi:hypothetical protein
MHPNPVIKAILELKAINSSKMVDENLTELGFHQESDVLDQPRLENMNIVDTMEVRRSEEKQTTLDTELKKTRENGSNK